MNSKTSSISYLFRVQTNQQTWRGHILRGIESLVDADKQVCGNQVHEGSFFESGAGTSNDNTVR